MSEVIFGIHACEAILKKSPDQVIKLWLQKEGSTRIDQILALAQLNRISIEYISKQKLDQKSQDQVHQGVLLEIKPFSALNERTLKANLDKHEEPVLYLVLDCIQDPHNLGAIIRTAEALGVTGLIIPKSNSVNVTPTVRKVACGAEVHLPIYIVANLARSLELLKANGIWIVGTVVEAPKSFYQSNLSGNLALVMGNEQKGLRALTVKHCDELVSIPLQGATASLNVSVATGIGLSEAIRQRTL